MKNDIYYANVQKEFTNNYGYTLKITAVNDEDYNISITSPDGGYQVMFVPGNVLELWMKEFIFEPKSLLVKTKEQKAPINFIKDMIHETRLDD